MSIYTDWLEDTCTSIIEDRYNNNTSITPGEIREYYLKLINSVELVYRDWGEELHKIRSMFQSRFGHDAGGELVLNIFMSMLYEYCT